MGLMNKTEYSQACLFRIREALETTSAWWNNDPRLSNRKIEKTIDMLEDIVDELNYFQDKVDFPTDSENREEDLVASTGRDQDELYENTDYAGYDPHFGHNGLFTD